MSENTEPYRIQLLRQRSLKAKSCEPQRPEPNHAETPFHRNKKARHRCRAHDTAARVRADFAKHVGDISGKYVIPGETQDLALMFVPSESVYMELHDSFDDVVQKAFRSHVVIVSPCLLMLAIHVIQQIQRDARMRGRQQIHVEVGHLVDDIALAASAASAKAFQSGQRRFAPVPSFPPKKWRNVLLASEKSNSTAMKRMIRSPSLPMCPPGWR